MILSIFLSIKIAISHREMPVVIVITLSLHETNIVKTSEQTVLTLFAVVNFQSFTTSNLGKYASWVHVRTPRLIMVHPTPINTMTATRCHAIRNLPTMFFDACIYHARIFAPLRAPHHRLSAVAWLDVKQHNPQNPIFSNSWDSPP